MTLRRSAVWFLIAGGIAAAGALAVWRCVSSRGQGSGRAELIAALGAVRPVPGRLAGLAYGRYPTGLAQDLSTGRRRALSAAARKVHRAAIAEGGARRGDLALLRLVEGDLGAAVVELEAAARQAPHDGRLESDLCSMHLEQARRGEAEAHLGALEAAHAAVAAAPLLLAARFNLALSLEVNGLREAAAAAWTDYLRRDPDSHWAAEAREHRARMEAMDDAGLWANQRAGALVAAARGGQALLARLCRRFPNEMEQLAEERLLGGWSAAYAAGNGPSAGAALATARALGAALAATGGQPMVAGAVAAIDRGSGAAPRGKDGLLLLAEAQRELASGERLCLNQGAGGALRLDRARAVLAAVGSPLAQRAVYDVAVCAYEQARYDEALVGLKGLLAGVDAARDPRLAGNALLMIGLCELASGRPDQSLRAYEAARRIFVEHGAAREAGHAVQELSENLRYLGERREALQLLLEAARVAVASGESRALYRAFDALAEEAERRGASSAALDFRDEVLRVAQRVAARSALQEAGLAHAWLRRGEARLAAGDSSGARVDLAAAARYVERIGDPDARRLREADLLLAEGRLLLATDPRGAVRQLSGAVRAKLEQQSVFFLLAALETRARAELALGDRAAAAADLAAALGQFERQRGEVMSLVLRTAYLDRVGALFDLAIGLAAEAPGGAGAAWELAERARARSLWDLAGQPQAAAADARLGREPESPALMAARRPLDAAALQRQLPAGVAVVEYAALPDRLLVWLLRRGDTPVLKERAIGASSVSELAERFRQALAAGDSGGASEALGAELSAQLLAPILDAVPAGEELVFVPDRALAEIPFAALRNPRTQDYVVEEHSVVVAPSATLFLGVVARSGGRREGQALSALLLANPRFDRGLYPDLPDLPGAAREARAVAAVYGALATMRLGPEATKQALLAEAGRYSVVHVAAHALADRELPALSRLVLTPAGGDDGSLYAYEVERRRFRGTQVVVLAACDSGRGDPERREGAQGLAWAFLAAGVPAVVASLWSVDDSMVGSQLAEFHRQFRASRDAAAALRSAQLALLRGPDPALRSPAVWASVELFGGRERR